MALSQFVKIKSSMLPAVCVEQSTICDTVSYIEMQGHTVG